MKNSLDGAYQAQQKWFNNRASTVFPLYINDNNDQFIVFQNYWRWKNQIEQVILNIRLRDVEGNLLSVKSFQVDEHNEISIKNEFSIKSAQGSI